MFDFSSFSGIESFLNANPVIFFILMAWTLYWKGMALWKASKANKEKWFIVMLILNTLGILEILYIYIFSKKGEKKEIVEK